MNQLQVYILECCDGSYYTGVTNDVERRVFEHNAGYDIHSYTHTRRPVKCVWISDPLDPNQAIELEKQIKGWSRKKKEAIINNRWQLLPELSKNRMKEKQNNK
jgi:putative endonuclease